MSDRPAIDPTSWLGQLTGTPGSLTGVSPQMFLSVLQDIARALNAQTNALTTSTTNTILSGGSVVLAPGTAGNLFINNTSGAPITVTLPTIPLTVGQHLDVKDYAGNAGTFAITFNTSDGSLIDGGATYAFVQNYQAASFRWNGSGWSVL